MRLAFETPPKPYEGDRIAALVVGWATLLKQANGGTWEQTMLDGINAENSYRAVRNVEISPWLISSRLGPDGQPLQLATEISDCGRNLLVDRELSKVVARLDLMAAQADEKYRRAALSARTGCWGTWGLFSRWCSASAGLGKLGQRESRVPSPTTSGRIRAPFLSSSFVFKNP